MRFESNAVFITSIDSGQGQTSQRQTV